MLSKPNTAAELVPESLQPIINYLRNIPQTIWYKGVCFILTVALLYSLVQWVWLLIPAESSHSIPSAASEMSLNKTATQKIDIARLQSYNIFGASSVDNAIARPAVKNIPQTVNATPTKLNLTLRGIVQASNEADALAIILYQNKEDQYAIGERLPVGRVKLSQIYRDHVIIENTGRYESLWLYQSDQGKPSSAPVTARKPVPANNGRRDMRSDKKVSSLAKDYRSKLYKNPTSLAGALRIKPKKINGVMQGYSISPGRDRAQFEQLGLKANDVVTNINGIALDDPAKAVEVYKIMRSAKEATFVIDREGQTMEMVVSLGEGQ